MSAGHQALGFGFEAQIGVGLPADADGAAVECGDVAGARPAEYADADQNRLRAVSGESVLGEGEHIAAHDFARGG
jgi:hypothetical protein